MKKYQQKNVLELLETLNEAHGELRKRIAPEMAVNLLADCQNFALRIGEYIEEIEGEGIRTETVGLLAEYSEIAFKISKGEGTTKELQRQLFEIEHSVRNELKPNKLEVVFFPYQLSMFDSFRSVYLAAKADPDCDAYCVPIPWFDRKADGTLGKMYYDGDRYLSDIEITDWRSYNVAERHPDVIFTQNPYDGINLVTSVHPDYYSSALKEKTNLLVFIDYGLPYWMPREPIDGTLLPSHTLSDLYVTYSKEYVEQTRYLLKRGVSAGLLPKQAMARERVAVLGSPKFDAVINTKRENCVLPDAWRRLMSGKKVLLLSTSVGAILQGNEKFIEKLQSALETLRGRNDIVVWWRPHPLSEATYTSMRPQLLDQYRSIVREYRVGGWGIYDDTPDLHRAIAWSDGCYTNESSLLFLYLATGKPFAINIVAFSPENLGKHSSNDFASALEWRIRCMRSAKGANIIDGNCTIWWHAFADMDVIHKVEYCDFLERFIHFILHEDEYPDAELYRQLKLQMFREFVANPDGTAGEKIYEHIKKRILEGI